ncbi:cytochrome c3 family protein [Paraliomyxa miuraensis]|uniref:cytochrome c3 family protein n=1 Tax=Paraliomyxa miuraensis TaxID=376150 RepID=UPI00225A2386|nr:cytochrome c3 family protein [Paraliomyxa miuraensis]MCX4239862.1 cytochrome c family protein [Paraliomyxa miuraensis]
MLAPLVGAGLVFAVAYWFSPRYTDVGYRPEQPVPYSHKLHAGDMGIDCRYCHNTVERSAHAAIPPTATCMNCHEQVKTESLRLRKVRESYQTGEPIEWVRVHQLPDYAYFNHSAHLAAGVGCASCHGRVDKMVVVEMVQPLSMGWCLDCHRNPEPNLRPLDQVTNMNWDPAAEDYDPKRDPARTRQVNPPLHCSGCHR